MSGVLRFFRYSGVALASAGSDWLLFSILVSAVGAARIESLMAARIVGGLVSFLANRQWTWKATRQTGLTRQGRRFLVLYACSYALAVGLFWLLVEVLAVPAYPGKLATDVICFLFNYAVMNAYVFHRRPGLGRFIRRHQTPPASEVQR